MYSTAPRSTVAQLLAPRFLQRGGGGGRQHGVLAFSCGTGCTIAAPCHGAALRPFPCLLPSLSTLGVPQRKEQVPGLSHPGRAEVRISERVLDVKSTESFDKSIAGCFMAVVGKVSSPGLASAFLALSDSASGFWRATLLTGLLAVGLISGVSCRYGLLDWAWCCCCSV